MNIRKTEKGITLLALVLTIILLVIISTVALRTINNKDMIEYAQNATEEFEGVQKEEQQYVTEIGSNAKENLGGVPVDDLENEDEGEGGGDKVEDEVEIAAITVEEAQIKGVLSTTDSTDVKDTYGNIIKLPAGFKITTDSNNVTEGIVIEDCTKTKTKGNQFVWIPIGKVYTSNDKANSKEINLNRYTFSEDGTEKAEGEAIIQTYIIEDSEKSEYENIIARNLEQFKLSAKTNGGYYIGRYETGVEVERDSKEDELTQPIVKLNANVYNYVTQAQASDLSRRMYDDNEETNVISDLVNSYAWDTAIVFIQSFSTGEEAYKYSQLNQPKVFSTTGGNKDEYCNINDMSGNAFEWSTETFCWKANPCVSRGGYNYNTGNVASNRTSSRGGVSASESRYNYSFRAILYL